MLWLVRVYLRFQSTPPARGATYITCVDSTHIRISIHAPREGGDYAKHFIYRGFT